MFKYTAARSFVWSLLDYPVRGRSQIRYPSAAGDGSAGTDGQLRDETGSCGSTPGRNAGSYQQVPAPGPWRSGGTRVGGRGPQHDEKHRPSIGSKTSSSI